MTTNCVILQKKGIVVNTVHSEIVWLLAKEKKMWELKA
jgi:hypothetical protein